MAKTTFGSGVVITSKFLNGAKEIRFDGADQDWHYQPLNVNDIQKSGDLGLDSRYLTRTTEQIISGKKTTLAPFHFGVEDECINCAAVAPKSFSTNHKWFGGTEVGAISRLENEDIITKMVLEGRLINFGFKDLADFDCTLPVEGNILVYREEGEIWQCSDELDGGTY